MLKRKAKPGFYSPCRCGQLAPRDSWVVWEYVKRHIRPVKIRRINVVVCKNCGRHDPNSKMAEGE